MGGPQRPVLGCLAGQWLLGWPLIGAGESRRQGPGLVPLGLYGPMGVWGHGAEVGQRPRCWDGLAGPRFTGPKLVDPACVFAVDADQRAG